MEVLRSDTPNYSPINRYSPLGDGITYKIALLNAANFEIIDVLSLAFERCHCGGYMIPFILLLDQNYDDKGEARWTNDQLLMKICSKCNVFTEKGRYTHHGLFSPKEYVSDLPEELTIEDRQRCVNEYCVKAYKSFRREFSDDLMGIAGHSYKVTGNKGEGFWRFTFYFKNKAVTAELPDDVDCDPY